MELKGGKQVKGSVDGGGLFVAGRTRLIGEEGKERTATPCWLLIRTRITKKHEPSCRPTRGGVCAGAEDEAEAGRCRG